MTFGIGPTEFISVLHPPVNISDWDHTKPHDQQPETVPQLFRDALAIRQEVFCGEQGVPIENEVDDDDKRSWHWIVNASVATTSSPPPENLSEVPRDQNGDVDGKVDPKAEEERRSSASAIRLPVGTIRLIPPPHGPNPYKNDNANAEAKAHDKKHPAEPYIKLGRLAVLREYRRLGLSKLLINQAMEFASKNPALIYPPPSPTTIEFAKSYGKDIEDVATWKGLCMVHAQVDVARLWKQLGFSEELVDEEGKVEIESEGRWVEEGIEHMAMWKRIKMHQPPLRFLKDSTMLPW